jgi:hypothetical protein
MAHFWPEHRRWMGALTDTRDQDRITYGRKFLLWMGLLTFLLKLGSRRQARFELDSPAALANLQRLSGDDQETLAHSDTLEHFLSHVPTAALAQLRRQMVQRLIRMKLLDHARVQGHLLVVIDGTGQLFFRQQHCPHCLRKTRDGQSQYYHHVLEAKLVTPEGLAISLDSEFIENADPAATKQDCELKAFARLAERLHRQYPQLRLCLGLDALYANGTVLEICQRFQWKYLITFKPGSLPALWQEYQTLLPLCPHHTRVVPKSPARPQQTLAWVHDLEHVDEQKRRHRLHALECREPGPQGEQVFAWLTNFRVESRHAAELANGGGRCRWKIENEGFNVQKNGGFNLEHAYSTKNRQIKNWYLLLQIAHMILQLLERGSLLTAACQTLFGSLRNLAKRLAESLRHHLIPPEALDLPAAAAIQIRLNSS